MKLSKYMIVAAAALALPVSINEAYAAVATVSKAGEKAGRDLPATIKKQKGIDYKAFKENLTPEERDYLEFLYQYMPLADIADHESDYFLENVRMALRARREMPWGKDIPEREFKYFVVPVRVNNEPLDGHRAVFYEELKDRVKNMSIEDAILEINHWCHEKATYQPSDGRTHSPLQTCYTAIGRCGEESTFTVAALRTMGIPARQVYTPRWAHTDDNHAWVEAYANGRWHFLGACEPEPVLDLGWFNAPASRGILMNTRVLGQYRGPEETLLELPDYTDINVTSNYAPTDAVSAEVYNADGTPADSANVSFCVYNYAEFYPLASRIYRKGQPVSLQLGKGEVLVWATDGKNFGFKKAAVGKDRKVKVILDGFNGSASIDLDIIPPVGSDNMPKLTQDQIDLNNRRKIQEDSIRKAYEATFAKDENVAEMARKLGLDLQRLSGVMKDSRGNWRVLYGFLSAQPADKRAKALRLLEVMAVKDRSDVGAEVLQDAMLAPDGDPADAVYAQYVLNPRVDQESLTGFHRVFYGKFGNGAKFKANPDTWLRWVKDNIALVPDWYPSTVRMSPEGVLATGKANQRSREIFFVTGARSFGIPARIDPVSGKTQWLGSDGEWVDVNLGSPKPESTASSCKGTLKLDYLCQSRIDDPKYYSHFSISKITDGVPQQLGFDDMAPWSRLFAEPYRLDCGTYMLVTGQRLANGGILARMTEFEIKDGEETRVTMTLRQDSTAVQVIGGLDAETLFLADGETSPRSILSQTGRGYYVLGLVSPLQEPSIHAFNDIAAAAEGLNAAGLPMLMLVENPSDLTLLKNAAADKKMPDKLTLGVDVDGKALKQLVESLKIDDKAMPVFVIADTFNRVVFVVQGYTIGLGEKLLDIIHKINR